MTKYLGRSKVTLFATEFLFDLEKPYKHCLGIHFIALNILCSVLRFNANHKSFSLE